MVLKMLGVRDMSKYYINQKLSFRDRFTIKDEAMEDIFYAEGEFFTLGKKIKLYTMAGEEMLYIRQKIWTILSKYEFFVGEQLICEMKQEFTFFKKKYNIVQPNWLITGDVWAYNYEIRDASGVIATIKKKWFSFMDAYEIDVHEEEYLELVLGVVIAIDADLEAAAAASSGS